MEKTLLAIVGVVMSSDTFFGCDFLPTIQLETWGRAPLRPHVGALPLIAGKRR
jgi:hypothetical protein